MFQKLTGLFKGIPRFIQEVRQELSKVAWSTRQELMASTMVIIVVTAILAAFIGIIDVCLSQALQKIFS
ncbi:MAG: preprotein translocase subunit SecE [Candidatus Omnitrophica bacterium]|nr:preprotein translocase subunit SecE [Candidatus Omnitrophota bacterium]